MRGQWQALYNTILIYRYVYVSHTRALIDNLFQALVSSCHREREEYTFLPYYRRVYSQIKAAQQQQQGHRKIASCYTRTLGYCTDRHKDI